MTPHPDVATGRYHQAEFAADLAQVIAKKGAGAEQLIARWSPALLRMELDRWLWKDATHLSPRKL